jgi:hypothetical protein
MPRVNNVQVPGFTKRTEDGDWLYSMSVAEVITTYFERFPRLLDAVSRRLDNDTFYEEDLFPKAGFVLHFYSTKYFVVKRGDAV